MNSQKLATQKIRKLRQEVDDLDKQLLKIIVHRFKTVQKIGRLKKSANLQVFQKSHTYRIRTNSKEM